MWTPRGIVQDNDIVPLTLVKGKNEILVEVQDMQGGWGFTARFLDDKALTGKLVNTVASGDLDETKKLIGFGANVNGTNENGVSMAEKKLKSCCCHMVQRKLMFRMRENWLMVFTAG